MKMNAKQIIDTINKWRIEHGLLPYSLKIYFVLETHVNFSSETLCVSHHKLIGLKDANRVIESLLQGGPSWLNAHAYRTEDNVVVVTLRVGAPVGAPHVMLNATDAFDRNPKIKIINE